MTDLKDSRPGLNDRRLVRLMAAAIKDCGLDLDPFVVFTEAASGAYVTTPVLAAMAKAKHVYALTQATRYGSVQEITEATMALASEAGVAARVEVVTIKRQADVAAADIVTNSGHVRPIDATMVSWMKPSAVVPLMYEAWELRPDDVDLAACRRRSIAVAGTNECHEAVGVFPYLGIMAVKLLLDAGIPVYKSQVLVLCDNAFGPFVARGLSDAGAKVELSDNFEKAGNGNATDAILVALTPRHTPVVDDAVAALLTRRFPGATVVQFWGDVDRRALRSEAVPFWPLEAPRPGHMGILPSLVGPEPIIRLQAGGLKVGEVMAKARASKECAGAIAAAVASGFGQAVEF